MAFFTLERIKRGLAAHIALMKHKAMHRLQLKTDRLDFMTRMAAQDNGLTPEEFIASADTIFLGGSETTATLLSGITYFLLRHPRVYKQVVNEIRTKFTSEDQIDLASVNTLDYMLACLTRLSGCILLSQVLSRGGRMFARHWQEATSRPMYVF
jgi:cytochrome P450